MSGWPSTVKEILPVLQLYCTFQEELTIEGDKNCHSQQET